MSGVPLSDKVSTAINQSAAFERKYWVCSQGIMGELHASAIGWYELEPDGSFALGYAFTRFLCFGFLCFLLDRPQRQTPSTSATTNTHTPTPIAIQTYLLSPSGQSDESSSLVLPGFGFPGSPPGCPPGSECGPVKSGMGLTVPLYAKMPQTMSGLGHST